MNLTSFYQKPSKETMNRRLVHICIALIMVIYLAHPGISHSVTNSSSKFSQARQSASQLDLILFNVEQQWRTSILEGSDYFHAIAPLVIKARVFIHCYYDTKTDKIAVVGFISNEEDFFQLTLFDRKELLKQTLNLLSDFMASKVNYATTKKPLKMNDIKLELVLNSSPPRARGVLKDCGLPNGQAGFVDGKLIFAEELYLTIRSEDAWKKGEPSKNTIIMIPFSSI